jgi:hypothetical protein
MGEETSMSERTCSDCGKEITRKSKTGKCPKCANAVSHVAARRAMPADFPALANRLQGRALRQHYNAGRSAVTRWMSEAGITPPNSRSDAKPVPPDFAEIAPGMTRRQLSLHYLAHANSVKRWIRLSGIEPATYRPPKREIVVAPKATRWVTYGAPHAVKIDTARDTSLEGLAAEHLRCATRAPVYRCTDHGRADPQGPLWRYGNVILSPADLFVRAHRHGFEARRFAA